jgi:CheY-like chemotaxis protein
MRDAMSRVLVIESYMEVRKLFTAILQRSGHQVFEAANSTYGITLAEQIYPDVIVLDLELDAATGWSVLRALKADQSTKEIPIVGVTTHIDRYYQQPNVQQSVSTILHKPFELHIFLDQIAAIPQQFPATLQQQIRL